MDLMNRLENSVQIFRSIVEKNADGIILLDEYRTIQYINDSAIEILDRDRNQLIGISFDFIFLPGEKTEVDLVRKDGRHVIAELRKVNILVADVSFEIISIRDITQRKLNEEDLSLMRKFEAISILSGGISHDFNNLLQSIIGFIELSIDEAYSNTLKENLSGALNSAMEAKCLTKRFLQLSNQMAPKLGPVPVQLLLRKTVASFSEVSGCPVHIELPGDLQPVLADEMQVSKALSNILRNAVEATGHNGIVQVNAKNVRIEDGNTGLPFTLKKGKYVKIVIKDNGRGIPKKDFKYIFDPYFSTKQRSVERGLGLGLSTAYNIIKSHRGYIIVDSIENIGTTVNIFLQAFQ